MSAPNPTAVWFLLGREPTLSTAEIISLLRRERIVYDNLILQQPFLTISADIKTNIINQLGGTIKIATELGSNLSEQTLLSTIQEKLSSTPAKIIFGISLYGEAKVENVERWGKELKKNLKAEGHSVRYVFKGEPTLSSVTVEKNSLISKGHEFLILKTSTGYRLARTTAVQPFENFSNRDYGRPGRDAGSGMLPPKLAMMLINLSEIRPDQTLLDPFCGSGTIISEAILLGYQKLLGTDASDKAIADSRKNIAWLVEQNPTHKDADWKVELVSVQKLGEKFSSGSIDGIATEPYLGKPKHGRESLAELESEAKELAKLYLDAFLEFKKILRPGGRVVFIIPRFVIRAGPLRRSFSEASAPITISDKILPQLQKLGFAVDQLLPKLNKSQFLLYQRPDQLVAREIWRFRLA